MSLSIVNLGGVFTTYFYNFNLNKTSTDEKTHIHFDFGGSFEFGENCRNSSDIYPGKAQEFIENNFEDKFSVDQLAAMFALGRRTTQTPMKIANMEFLPTDLIKL